MNRRVARVGILAAASVLAISALSGCAPASPVTPPNHHKGSSSGTSNNASPPNATPTATPTPTGPPPLPANALFQISATAAQPDGATVDLVETVYAPSAPTASDTALLNTQCNISGQPKWQASYPSSVSYLIATMTAQPRAGTPAWNTNADVATEFGGYVSAYSGAYHVAQADCAPGWIGVPGTVHGVTPVPAANSAKGKFGWASSGTTYGFDGDGNDPSDPNGGGSTIVSNCVVQLSAAAIAAAPAISAWTSQPFVQTVGCYYKFP
jgi:hypothetical protein